jgi:hypothetical protein
MLIISLKSLLKIKEILMIIKDPLSFNNKNNYGGLLFEFKKIIANLLS